MFYKFHSKVSDLTDSWMPS